MRSWDHLSYGITQCNLPPDGGDSHAFTPACCWYWFIDPGRMKGWVHLGGWLYQDGLLQTVTHPSINPARRRVTALIETNALPLNEVTTSPHMGSLDVSHFMHFINSRLAYLWWNQQYFFPYWLRYLVCIDSVCLLLLVAAVMQEAC